MSLRFVSLPLLAALLLTPTVTFPQLILRVDAQHQTIQIEGTDTGTLDIDVVEWEVGPPTGVARSVDDLETLVVATPVAFGAGSLLVLDTGGISLGFGPGGLKRGRGIRMTTIVGTGATASYASLGPVHRAVLENAVGSSLPLNLGTGFADLQIEASPVSIEARSWGRIKAQH